MGKIKAVVFDYDGVLARGRERIAGAAETVKELRNRGIRVFVLTDKSTMSRKQFQNALRSIGLEFGESELLTSPMAVAAYLLDRHFQGDVLVIGEHGLKKEIADAGFRIVEKAPAEAIVVGMDRKFNYDKITQALNAIRSGALFVAANYNPSYPVEEGIAPGSAAMVGAISAATQKEPDQNLGKPNTFLLKKIADSNKFKPEEIAVVGDSLKTDIALANAYGALGILVLTGCDTAEQVASAAPSIRPAKVIRNLKELLKLPQLTPNLD